MKKFLAILLAVSMLLLAGCGGNSGAATAETQEEVVETTQAPTETTVATEPTETEPPVPETVSAAVRADKTPLILTSANRGDVLDIAGEYDENHYVVKLEAGYGLIEKRLVRMDSEEPYQEWTGYARYNAKVYPSYQFRPAEGQVLNMNTKLQVLDSLGSTLVVQLEDGIGYIKEAEVSQYYIQPSGGGGGSADGGDISLGFSGGITRLSVFVPQTGEVSGTATVLADGAEILLGWFDSEDTVQIVTEEGFAESREGFDTIYVDGMYGYIRQSFLLHEGEAPYEMWDGYAKYGTKLYADYSMSGEAVDLNMNTKIQILGDLGDCYLVLSGEAMGYIVKDMVSQYPIATGGGGGGGGEWTPPAM